MSDITCPQRHRRRRTGGGSSSAIASRPSASSGSTLTTDRGKTSIADSVVEKIAGMAARQVSGVHELGRGSARALGSLRDRLPVGGSASPAQGVSVEVGERQAAVDLDVVAEYGVSIVDLAQSIRDNVIEQIEGMTGLEVTEVNVSVDDVYMGESSDDKTNRGCSERTAALLACGWGAGRGDRVVAATTRAWRASAAAVRARSRPTCPAGGSTASDSPATASRCISWPGGSRRCRRWPMTFAAAIGLLTAGRRAACSSTTSRSPRLEIVPAPRRGVGAAVTRTRGRRR